MEALILAPIIMILTIFHEISHISSQHHNNPPPAPSCNSSCGNIRIRFPFRLETDPPSCGLSHAYADYRLELSCKNNLTILNTGYGGVYIVKAINYNNYTVRLVDQNIQKGNCSSIPGTSFDTFKLSQLSCFDLEINFFEQEIRVGHTGKFWSRNVHVYPISETVVFLSCEKPVFNTSYIDTTPCISNISPLGHSYSKSGQYSYAVYSSGFKYSDLAESCQIDLSTLISSRKGSEDDKKKKMITTSYRDLHDELAYGFELTWIGAYRKYCYEDLCYVDDKTNEVRCVSTDGCGSTKWAQWCRLWQAIVQPLMMSIIWPILDFIIPRYKTIVEILAPRTIIGISFVIALIIYKWKRRHLSIYDGIEEFLRNHNNLMPIRYAYSDIKKMTEGFKTKLGEGGFGSVYKGKLRSGHFVAVKMLGKSNTTGQDFINEVATIGRIHHVNIVRLVGFCVEGSKRALVYEFMPNGSLNKYTSGEETNISLSSEEIFDISLGIARGIDYLHRGCDMKILHFDIKPHNILLDENFIPKVSDFGLARLCPLENSLVSLTAVRGTIGYIAPELFYKNIGGVSHKADVYSFGMLLMEMASRRKNLKADAEHSSQIYFPLWIYDQVNKEKSIELEDVTDQEQQITKKMIVVALWCIQMKPCDRPSMNKVIEMLEGDIECLQMPPKPSFYPKENYNAENAGGTPSTTCPESVLDEDSTD